MADVWVLTHSCGWSRMLSIDSTPEERAAVYAEHMQAHE